MAQCMQSFTNLSLKPIYILKRPLSVQDLRSKMRKLNLGQDDGGWHDWKKEVHALEQECIRHAVGIWRYSRGSTQNTRIAVWEDG